jgi:DNA processing protein
LVSGGAKGIDQAAMRGALEADGIVTGVLADSLEKTTMNRDHRNLLLQGQLVLISPYDPSAGFNVGHAMQRNKIVYAVADAALVVSADFNKGGTWAGATEQLDKLHLVRVYVRSTGEASKGLEALRKKGAFPWPNPEDAEAFDAAIFAGSTAPPPSAQAELSFAGEQPVAKSDRIRESPSAYAISVHDSKQSNGDSALDPGDELFGMVRSLVMQILQTPRNSTEVASELRVTKPQAEQWLRRLVKEGILEKRTKPVRYVTRQVELFEDRQAGGPDAPNAQAGSPE